jgi:hypothetical protein
VEYVVLALGIIASMFFILEIAIYLKGGKPIELDGRDPMSYLQFLLIGFGFFLAGVLLYLGIGIASESGASAAIKAVMNIAFYGWGLLIIIFTFSMLVYYVYLVPKWWKAMVAKKSEEEDEE